jgi:hypothetical protein
MTCVFTECRHCGGGLNKFSPTIQNAEGETFAFCDDDCGNAYVREDSLKDVEDNISRSSEIVSDLKKAQKHKGWKKMKHHTHLENHYKAEFARFLLYKALLTRKPKDQCHALKDGFIKRTEILFTELFDDDEAKEQFPTVFYETGEDLTPQNRTLYWDSMIKSWGV